MRRYLYTGILCLFGTLSFAQVRISNVSAEEWVKKNFGGQGVVIGKVKQNGNTSAAGSFTSTPGILDITSGLILSTGNAVAAGGMNDKYNITSAFSEFPQTDTDLSKLVAQKLYDIRSVEFDFVPMANSIQFNYQFGSDEYPEYIGSAYNDIFAFFVSDGETTQNIALVPGKKVPVNINNINSQVDPALFTDNNVFSAFSIRKAPVLPSKTAVYERTFVGKILYAIGQFFTIKDVEDNSDKIVIRPDEALMKTIKPELYRNLQYDGITKKLVAQAYVQPYKKYHLKLIIADVADNIYDSGVFIEGGSFSAKRDTTEPGFIDYPNLSKIVDANKILEGQALKDLIPNEFAIDNAIIYFDFDQFNINPGEEKKLASVASWYQRLQPDYILQLTGHTDSVGNLSYNTQLSKNRNDAVIAHLSKLAGVPVKLSSAEKAFLEPAAPNATDDGRQKNRRVEIKFVRTKNAE